MLHTDFNERRKKLLNSLDKNSIAIIVASPEIVRNGDSHFLYRQNSDFFYLTGLSEPEAVAVFAPGSEFGNYILFNRPKDKLREQWDGVMAGQEGACEIYGADSSFPIMQVDAYLTKLMQDRSKIYFDFGKNAFDSRLTSIVSGLRRKVRAGISAPICFSSLEYIVNEFRLIKSPYELELMRHAIKASVAGHQNAMKICKPGLMEYHLSAEVHYAFQKQGCRSSAYNSIVGSGANACVLHYIQNQDELKSKDLVLIDAGAEYKNYAADITRTFPVDGKFTQEQKAIYELVLQAQKAALQVAKPGVEWITMQEAIIKTLTTGLVELKILQGNVDALIEEKAYMPFYMHNSGHWLGMDVHDAGTYKVDGKWRTLKENMALTIEPGLYISAAIPNVDKRWWNIGVRIEDDVLITATGSEVLSNDLIKEIADIEAYMQ